MLIVYLFVFILGLVLGSFANVLIWRIPRGMKITGRSMCRRCKNKISWFDNIPILSFFILHGKCRNCKSNISLRYPLVELLAGIIFVLFFLKFGLTSQMFFFSFLSPIFISIFFIDLEHQIIPDELVFAGLALTLTFNFSFLNLFSGCLAAVFLLLLHFITNGRGMGLGDVKFALLGGMIVGLTNIFYWFFIAFLTGAVVGCILILVKKYGLKSKIAFGPFLIFALFLTIFLRL
jgi:leader peptidase (prepilin peptidase)/N-methyltransferase